MRFLVEYPGRGRRLTAADGGGVPWRWGVSLAPGRVPGVGGGLYLPKNKLTHKAENLKIFVKLIYLLKMCR